MIKFENVEVVGFEAAIRGMRNPMNSWGKSDSYRYSGKGPSFKENGIADPLVQYSLYAGCDDCIGCHNGFEVGSNDLDLMKRLRAAGTDHRKFMRMIVVYADVTAPLYWWKEFDTYKVGVVANSCSTMHKIAEQEFVLDDFSHEHLLGPEDMIAVEDRTELSLEEDEALSAIDVSGAIVYFGPKQFLQMICNVLNRYRKLYLETKDKRYWWQMIQLLPSSYNQRRTVMLNYEVLANIYKSRKNHKLDEWAEHECTTTEAYEWGKNVDLGFCDWIKTLPYSELITGEED